MEKDEPISIEASKECPVCQSPNASRARFCNSCGYRFMMISSQTPIAQSPSSEPSPSQVEGDDFWDTTRRSGRPRAGTLTWGAILTILCGVLDVLGGILLVGMGNYISEFYVGTGTAVIFCGSLIAVLGLVAISGGFTALNAEKFVLSLVGSVLGLIGMVMAYGFFGFIPGILAVILLAKAHGEFTT